MNISLIPFSLLHVPHIIGNTWMWLMMMLNTMLTWMERTMRMLRMVTIMTWDVPGGATAIIEPRIRVNQSSEGNQPSAGLIMMIMMMSVMILMMMRMNMVRMIIVRMMVMVKIVMVNLLAKCRPN